MQNRFLIPTILLVLVCPSLLADVVEIEPNNTTGTAQVLESIYTKTADPDIGDTTTNTSTTIPHQTIIGSGTGPASKDIFEFFVPKAGTAVFDIDDGQRPIHAQRLGIATQLDGTIWVKNSNRLYFLDENRRLQFSREINYAGYLANVLAVHPVSGLFYSIDRENKLLVTVDGASGEASVVGPVQVGGISALAFNDSNELFAVTGTGNNVSKLYQLNPATGTTVGQIGDTGKSGIKGLAFHPQTGVLYASASENSLDLLINVTTDNAGTLYSPGDANGNYDFIQTDPDTGLTGKIGSVGAAGIQSLAFDAADNLYGITHGGPMSLYRLDASSGAVLDGPDITELLNAAAFDIHPVNGLLYVLAEGGIWSVQPVLAATSTGTVFGLTYGGGGTTVLVTFDFFNETVHPVGIIPIDDITALAFDASDRLFVLGAISSNDQNLRLYEIDPSDGSVIDPIGDTGTRDLLGLAFDPMGGGLYSTLTNGSFDTLGANLASDLAGNYYSVDQEGVLYRFDVSAVINNTLAVTQLGNTGIRGITALAFDGTDRLFALNGQQQGTSTLLELDKNTGALLDTVGPTGVNGMVGLDFHPSTGVLYGHSNKFAYRPWRGLTIDSSGTALGFDSSGVMNRFDPSDGLIEALTPETDGNYSAFAFDSTDRLFAIYGGYDNLLDTSYSELREVDPANGGTIRIIGRVIDADITGIAFHPESGVLYGHVLGPNRIITIDTSTAAATIIGNTDIPDFVYDIAFHDDGGVQLFGVRSSSQAIVTFDLGTGQATAVGGVLGVSPDEAGIASDGSTLWVTSGQAIYQVDPTTGVGTFESWLREPGMLYTLDKTTGVASPVAPTDAPANVSDISFDPMTDQLVGWSGGSFHDTVLIDIVTGAVTEAGGLFPGANQIGIAHSRGGVQEIVTRSGTSVNVFDGSLQSRTLIKRAPQLVTINPTTAEVSPVGPTLPQQAHSSYGRFTDLAFDTNPGGGNPNYGILYGYHQYDGDLYTINLITGEATLLGDSGDCCQAGIAYNGATLLKIDGGPGNVSTLDQGTGAASLEFNINPGPQPAWTLYTVDRNTLEVTELGPTGQEDLYDLEFDDSGALFGWKPFGSDPLYSINTTTGAASLVGGAGIPNTYGGLGYDSNSGTLFLRGNDRLWEIDPMSGSASFVTTLGLEEDGLYTVSTDDASVTRIGQSLGYEENIPDITFDAEGRLWGFEVSDWDSLVELDLGTGAGTTHTGFFPSNAGLAFSSDGTFWVKNGDSSLFTVDTDTGQGTLATAIQDVDQYTAMAIDSTDLLYVFDTEVDYGSPLYSMNRLTGEVSLIGETGIPLFALAFDGADNLFGMANDGEESFWYQVDPADATPTLLSVGFDESLDAVAFHPDTGVLYAHRQSDGALVTLNPANASTTGVIGPTGLFKVDDLAFSPDGRLFTYARWYFSNTDAQANIAGFFEIDIATGAATPLGRFGHFESRLTLLDTDGVTPLAASNSADFRFGQFGSNTSYETGVLSDDAYLQYEFTTPGTYYLQVESADMPFVRVGATYRLQVSVPGGHGINIFIDGFESPP